jgi:hypothetical protein
MDEHGTAEVRCTQQQGRVVHLKSTQAAGKDCAKHRMKINACVALAMLRAVSK